jgi:hypothetical protein
MPIPLVPVAVAGAAAWLAFEPGQAAAPAPGAASAPEEEKPFVDPQVDPEFSLSTSPFPSASTANATPRAGGDPPPGDPVVMAVEGGIGAAENAAKAAVVGAASIGIHSVLTGGTLAEGFSAAGESIGNAAASVGSSASSAAEGAAGVVGPAVVIGADVLMVGGAVFTMLGGDLEKALGLTGGPLSPEFDASTAAGQFHGRAEAAVIKQSLADTGTKFARMGARDPSSML